MEEEDVERQFEIHPRAARDLVYWLRLGLTILGIALFITGAIFWIHGILSWNS